MTSDIKKFGKRVKDLRLEAGYSQEELSEKMGISREHLSLVERGQRYLGLKKVFLLAKTLNIKPCELFKFDKGC